ncbi:RrF2 family transcriptional regulator [Campylobacterota bacterium]
MQLLNSSKYAIRILGYIANHEKQQLCNAKELSEALIIPYKFLTKIMMKLVKADLIISIRGREGGYKLSKPASDITITEILNNFNEFPEYEQCILGIGACDNKKKCVLHDQWVKPKKMISKMFETTTLADIDSENFKL